MFQEQLGLIYLLSTLTKLFSNGVTVFFQFPDYKEGDCFEGSKENRKIHICNLNGKHSRICLRRCLCHISAHSKNRSEQRGTQGCSQFAAKASRCGNQALNPITIFPLAIIFAANRLISIPAIPVQHPYTLLIVSLFVGSGVRTVISAPIGMEIQV